MGGWPARRAVRDGLTLAGLLFAAYLFVVVAPTTRTVGFDAFAYWHVDPSNPYVRPEGVLGSFAYTPVAVRLFALAGWLSWPAFWWLWMAILVATAIWLGGRLALLVFAFPPVALELYHGNIDLLIAAAVALGFRYPASWAFVALTKVTPAVGIVWFAVRREWRRLLIATGVIALLATASMAVDGRLWQDWIRNTIVPSATRDIGGPSVPIPLALRLPAAVILVAWGARTDRRWTVPVGAMLALPVLWFEGFSILAACLALDRPALIERPMTTGSRSLRPRRSRRSG